MTTEAEVYEALRYCVEVDPKTGTRRYYNDAGLLHRDDGPAIIHKDYLGWFIQGREYTAAEFIEQQRNAGILLPALKDSYWFSQIPRVSKGLI